MPLTNDPAIERLTLAMLARELPKAEWTHAAHWAAALWLLRHRPEAAAPQAMAANIRAYNESIGGQNTDTSGYHETITIASLGAAADHLAKMPDADIAEALAALMASPLGHPDWLLTHWSREALFGVEARRSWLAPDIAPLPFAVPA